MSLWDAEALYIGGSSRAFIILSASLLFYHMTGSGTLSCNPVLAGLVASSLIIFEVCTSSMSLVPYIYRGMASKEVEERRGKTIYVANVVLGVSLLLIELVICGIVLYDCVQRAHTNTYTFQK